jgi:hypothetical protein
MKHKTRILAFLLVSILGIAAGYADEQSHGPPGTYRLSQVEILVELDSHWGPGDTVLIQGDGVGRYAGRGGHRDFVVSTEEFLGVLSLFYKYRFFDLLDEYKLATKVDLVDRDSVVVLKGLVFDNHEIRTTVRIGDYSKTVFDCFGAPPDLHDLESAILDIGGSNVDMTVGDREQERWSDDVRVQGRVEEIVDSVSSGGGVLLRIGTEEGVCIARMSPIYQIPPPAVWKVQLYAQIQALRIGDRIIAIGRGTRHSVDVRYIATPGWTR